ncbi:MAG: VCBS repeat-containing protein [Victivallales bacterium]|nr:VCBS repeat-containing protein [Victivallales bacterium]
MDNKCKEGGCTGRDPVPGYILLPVILLQIAAVLAQGYLTYTNKHFAPIAPYSLWPVYHIWGAAVFSHLFFVSIVFCSLSSVIVYVIARFGSCRKSLWASGGIIFMLWYLFFLANLFMSMPSGISFVTLALFAAQVIIVVFLLCSERKSNPVFPAILLLFSTIPLHVFINHRGNWLYHAWCFCYAVAVFNVFFWLISDTQRMFRKYRYVFYAAALVCGFSLALWNYSVPKKVSYGYYIGFAEIQFGNIDGDKYPDLFTCGYCGMIYGNPAWFVGRGTHFDDWEHGQELDGIRQMTAVLVDLDNDGDMDILSSEILINDNGNFDREIFISSELYFLFFGRERKFSIIASPLTPGDPFTELILTEGNNTFIGVCTEDHDWTFHSFDSKLHAAVDNSNPQGPVLLILNPAEKDVLVLLEKEHIPYRAVSLELDKQIWKPLFLYMDVNSDGEHKLLVWSSSGAMSKVSLFKELDGRFEQMSSFETGEYLQGPYDGYHAYPEFKFADFDLDGKIDFIGDDGWIYLQNAGYKFERARHVRLRRSKEASYLYACDINADGFPDVVSSYQPFTNIKMGPLF